MAQKELKEADKKERAEKPLPHATKHDKSEKHRARSHKKVFDVVPPGKAPASPTSRPVITGHKPPVADDQFVVKTAPPLRAANPNDKHDLLDPKQKKELTPLSDDDSPDQLPDKVPAAETLKVNVATAPVLPVSKPSKADTSSMAADDSSHSHSGASSAKTVEYTSKLPQQSDELPADQMADRAGLSFWEPEDEPTPAHLAMEQVVDADDGIESHHLHGSATHAFSQGAANAPGPSSTAVPSPATPAVSYATPNHSPSAKTIDQLLAETGAPNLDSDNQIDPVISHHKSHSRTGILLLLLLTILILAAITLNLLLDAGYIDTPYNIPHTNFL